MEKKFLTKRTIKFLVIFLIFLGLIFFNPGGFFNPLRVITLKLVYPFQKTFYLTGRLIKKNADLFISFVDIKKENESLLKENYLLQSELANFKEQRRENEILRSEINLAPRNKFDLEASFVVGQDPQGLGNWIMIDKGSRSGIQAGMPVIVSQGIFVGKIEEVFSESSRVILLSHAESAVNAFDLETGARGVIKGEYGLGIIMDMVSQKEVLNVGDSILTSGLGGNFPKGLLLGKIQEVKLSQDKLFQQAIINSSAKLQSLEVVFVIKK